MGDHVRDRPVARQVTPLAGEDEETYGKRLRVSYSKLSLYQRCPRSYHKSYVEKKK